MTMNNCDKQRKIGILTFHCAKSYGAVLQCYALSQTISRLFPDNVTGIVDYCPLRFASAGKRGDSEAFRNFITSHMNFITPQSTSLKECLAGSGITDIVVGSDQVWNPTILKDTLKEYFLCDIPENINKHSYAASFGVAELSCPPEINDILGSALQDFKSISVREASGIDICKKLGRKGAVRVLDPTLLAGREVFDPIADESSALTASVVGFFLSPTPLQIKVLKTIAREKNIRRSDVLVLNRKTPFFSFIKSSLHPEIKDFLHAIKNAQYVVTDSFHGVCFAVLFEKQFIILPSKRKERFTRIAEMLEMLDLSERVMYGNQISDAKSILNSTIDFENICKRLLTLRKHSLDFLKNII